LTVRGRDRVGGCWRVSETVGNRALASSAQAVSIGSALRCGASASAITRSQYAGADKLPPQANSWRMATHAAIFSLAVIALCGYQELVPHDIRAYASQIRNHWLSGGSWNDLCRRAGLDHNVQTSIERRYEPKNGGNHRRISDSLGLLRIVDCLATSDRMECDCGSDKFPVCPRVRLLRADRRIEAE
jgi:hypothetical protein